MDIAQLLTLNGASTAPQPGQAAPLGESGFSLLMQQADALAKLKSATGATPAAEGGDKAPSLEALLSELEAIAQNSDIASDGLAGGTTQNDAAGIVAALAALLSNNMTSSANAPTDGLATTGRQPGDTGFQPLAPSLAQGDDRFDLNAIRERLNVIAHAQRGETAQPLATPPAATDSTRAALQALTTQQPSGQTNDNVLLRHQQLTAQGLQQLSAQHATLQSSDAQQPGTLQPASVAETISTAAVELASASRGSEHGASPAAGNIPGPLATGGTQAQAQPQATPAMTLNAPLASAQWQQGLGQQLIALQQRGGHKVDLHLHPAELGPLSISLKMDDQLAQAQFFSTNPQVRAAVEQAIPQLREVLAENGIQLGEAMVGEQQQQGDGRQDARNAATLASGSPDAPLTSSDEDQQALASQATPLDNQGLGVDLYA